jgi:probable F420-dependent oxidoreductase
MHIGWSTMNTPLDPTPIELAKALEERGFESLWMGEHSHIPCSRKTPWPAGDGLPEPYKQISDPYISLAAAAAVTTRLKVGTGIALLNQRNIFVQAKTIATLDRLSGGRLLIGGGIGWNEEEFENTSPHPWKKRYTLLRETVEAMRALWRDEEAEYHGKLVDFDAVWSGAIPSRPEGPPILLGVSGPLGVEQAAAWADGWMPPDIALENLELAISGFRAQLVEHGRDPGSVPISLQAMNTPDLDRLRELQDLGIERVIVGVAMDNWGQPEKVLPMMDEIAKFIPQVR